MLGTIIGSIFGSSKTTEKVVDGVYNGLDKMFFTDEEKSEANMMVLKWRLDYANATRGQNMSRRFIAMIVSMLWALMIVAMVVAKGFGFDGFAEYTFNVMKDVVLTPFGIIIGFYFLAHVTKGLRSSE